MDETSAKSSSTAEVFFEVETDMDVSLDPYSSLYAAPTSATSTTATTTTTSTMTASATADAATATSTAGVDPVLQQMNPAYVARHEQLLLPSLHGEGMIQTWSTLAEPDAGALQQYVQYAVRHKENVVVVPSARLLQSRLDAYLVNIGVRRGSLRLVGGVPVVMTTDLLVHTAASPLDIFRALVQVNHMTCELNRGASSGASMIDNRRIGNSNGVVTVEQAVAVLQGVPKECIRSAQLRSRAFQRNLVQDAVQRVGQVIRNIRHSDVNNSPTNTCTASNASGASNEEVGGSEFNAYSTELDAEQVLLEQLGVGRHSLFERYQRAHRFEGENLSGIMSLLKEAGWAADRFMFGAINRRVEW